MFESVERKAARLPALAPRVAATLPIGRTNGRQEQQADSLADRAMRTTSLRLASTGGSTGNTAASTGRALEASIRNYFEPRFGSNLGGVRVHSDRAARTSAAMINARAFTVGSDIFYGAGERPDSDRLTAHELAHVVENNRNGGPNVLRRAPGGASFEIASPIWNVSGRPVVIVRMNDGRSFFFYRRSGKGPKGSFEAVAPGKNKWVPFEGFEEVEDLHEGRPRRWARFHKEPYYYGADAEAGAGYGTQTHKNIAQWLDDTIPLEQTGQTASWRAVQSEFDAVAPRNLPVPGTQAPQQAVTASGEIGGKPPESSGGGGKVTATSEETTQRITKPKPTAPEALPETAPKPSTTPEAPSGGLAPEAPSPKPGFRAKLSGMKSGFAEGLKGAFNPEGIAAEIPFIILHFADRAAVQDAIRNIQVKFAKEGFAKGYAAGVAGWSQSEVDSDLKNRVTDFRVKGLGDPGGQLTMSYILQLAEAYENYAVDLGFARSSRLGSRWKEKTLEWAYARLDKNDYVFSRDERVRYTYEFIDKLAWVLSPTTNQLVQDAIDMGDLKRRFGL